MGFQSNNRKKIYFGAPLFSESECLYNQTVVDFIRQNFADKVEIYLPQENQAINDKSNYANSIMIADGDNAYLEEADILIAVLDGVNPDSGLSAEIGYFYSMNKPIIGLYTDSRQGIFGNEDKIRALDEIAESQVAYVNLYVIGLVKKRGLILNSSSKLINELKKYLD